MSPLQSRRSVASARLNRQVLMQFAQYFTPPPPLLPPTPVWKVICCGSLRPPGISNLRGHDERMWSVAKELSLPPTAIETGSFAASDDMLFLRRAQAVGGGVRVSNWSLLLDHSRFCLLVFHVSCGQVHLPSRLTADNPSGTTQLVLKPVA